MSIPIFSTIGLFFKDIRTQISISEKFSSDCREIVASFKNELYSSDNSTSPFQTPIELYSSFLKYCAIRNKDIAKAVLHDFEENILYSKDVHIICNELNLSKCQACTVIHGYFYAYNLTYTDKTLTRPPTLFNNESAKLMAMFGTQHSYENPLDEILSVYHAYHPLIFAFVERVSSFLEKVTLDPFFVDQYEYGLKFKTWLDNPGSTPPPNYLLSSNIVAPLAGVSQLLQFLVTIKALGITPGELANSFKASVGYSYGIVVATAISCSTDEESFYTNSEKALGILLLVSTFGQIEYPQSYSHIASNWKYGDSEIEIIRPMVSVKGLCHDKLNQLVRRVNSKRKYKHTPTCISAINTSNHFIVSGDALPIEKFVQLVRAEYEPSTQGQSNVPQSKYRPVVTVEYLNSSVPYHCNILADAVDTQNQYAEDKGWIFCADDMQIPVHANNDGHDIRSEPDLTRYLFQSVMILPIDWPVVTNYPDITHIVYFGSSEPSGIGEITYRNIEGRGISVICAGDVVSTTPEFGTRADLYKHDLSSVINSPNWSDKYSPTLVHTAFDNKIHISTKMSRLLGKPPVMVPGMVPTTANEDLVAATLNAGYHIEFLCTGINTEAELNGRIERLVESIEPGCSITLNCSYSNSKQWSFQYPAIVENRRKGVPIEGLCISDCVPALDLATEIIDTISEAGFRHIAFKPKSVESIYQAIDIAKASPDFPIILQWDGSHIDGLTQYIDIYQPIIDTYNSIRKQENIVLVTGFEFNNVDDPTVYLTGEWNAGSGHAPMPFDGLLFGSQMPIIMESKTDNSVKELIASSPDITIVKLEDGESIHVIANRCSLFWKELDSTIFSVPNEDRLQEIVNRREHIINHLNNDHTRPWFGTLPDGKTADIEDMTYIEIITRLADLLYIKNNRVWTNSLYKSLFNAFMIRIEEHFADIHHDSTLASFGLVDPYEQIDCIVNTYPDSNSQLVSSEDVKLFVELCKCNGQISVPFIPIFDESFETWFKKDIIWQSENLACVPDQDSQRAVIPHSPSAMLYPVEINIPAKDVLDGNYRRLVDRLLEIKYHDDADKIENVDYLSDHPPVDYVDSTLIDSIVEVISDSERIYTLPGDESPLPDSTTWACILSGGKLTWLYALLTSPVIADSKRLIDNSIHKVLCPRPSHTVRVSLLDDIPSTVNIIDERGLPAVDISAENSDITLTIHNHLKSGSVSLSVMYKYNPKYPVSFAKQEYDVVDPFVNFYRESIRLGTTDTFPFPPTLVDGLTSSYSDYHLSKHYYIQYLRGLGNYLVPYKSNTRDVLFISIDYLFVLAFPTLVELVTDKCYSKGIMNIAQLSNSTRVIPGARPLCTGDVISSNSAIVSALNIESGKQLHVRTVISRDKVDTIEMNSVFLIPNIQLDSKDSFSIINKDPVRVSINSNEDIMILRSKGWFIPDNDAISRIIPGLMLHFSIKAHNRYKSFSQYYWSSITGKVMLILDDGSTIKVGDVDYCDGNIHSNPVIEYLNRFGVHEDRESYFEGGGYTMFSGNIEERSFVTVSSSNDTYSRVSRDHTPLHSNVYVADYAGLPTTVAHSMHISALTRSFIDRYAAGDHPERVVAYNVSFVEMVSPRDKLIPTFDHIGMKDGRMLIKGSTKNQHGNVVLKFTAEVEQPSTAYLFTGQGLQCVGMGMDLYESSEAARSVWDKGNKYMLEKYGLPILNIVNKNPKRHTVYFKGIKGERIRESYIGLFPGVDKCTREYTFSSKNGLLGLTQFIQPILALFDYAAISDMREHGLIQRSAMFAGHSFGEFVAVCAISKLFTLEEMLDIVFYRGTVLELAAECDDEGRSEYRMAAVNPTKIGSKFTVDELINVVGMVKRYGSELLELINHNIEDQQYIVAGTITQLKTLSIVLSMIQEGYGSKSDSVESAVTYAVDKVSDERTQNGIIVLKRSSALVPINNVHVPSHSSQMLPFVEPFRHFLSKKLTGHTIDCDLLCSRYIPNAIGTPFEINREYFNKVYSATNSTEIKDVLDEWDDAWLDDSAKKQKIGKSLFVELIVNQISCPVQWISTQKYLLGDNGVERIIEIGPGPVLSDMMTKSAKAMGSEMMVLSIAVDEDEIRFRKINTVAENIESIITNADNDTTMLKRALPQTISISENDAAVFQSNPVTDIPLDPLYIARIIIAQKLKTPLYRVATNRTIESLVDGKSVLRNEIIGDLECEFGSKSPSIRDDIPIEDLAKGISSFSGNLGSYTSSQISQIFRNTLPGGSNRSSIHSYLDSMYGLGPMRRDGVLLLALINEPNNRFSSNKAVQLWIDVLVAEYSKIHSVSVQKFNENNGAGLVNAKYLSPSDIVALEKTQSDNRQLFTHIIEALSNNVGVDLRRSGRIAEEFIRKNTESQSLYDNVINELGEELVSGIKPLFSSLKARYFDSYWNWARQDLFELFCDLESGKVVLDSTNTAKRVNMLKNRSEQALLEFLSFCIRKLGYNKDSNSTDDLYATFVSKLYSECKKSLNTKPTYNVLHKSLGSKAQVIDEYIAIIRSSCRQDRPLLHIRSDNGQGQYKYDNKATETYLNSLEEMYCDGVTFCGKCVLMTGFKKHSISEEILKGLLSGGAWVIATISNYTREAILNLEDIYRQYGSRGSKLVVIPFNQGSVEDIKELVHFIYRPTEDSGGLGWELNTIIPLETLKNQNNSGMNADTHSELSLRITYTNIYRLFGEIANACVKYWCPIQSIQAIVPLSENCSRPGETLHYSGHKTILETLMHHWYFEPWSKYISLIGINADDIYKSETLERSNIVQTVDKPRDLTITFIKDEVSAGILCMIANHSYVNENTSPIILDISGFKTRAMPTGEPIVGSKKGPKITAQIQMAINTDSALDFASEHRFSFGQAFLPQKLKQRINYKPQFPKHKSYEDLNHLHYMQGMVNLDKVVVVTGFGEVGPYGNSKTRWEMEAYGEFSLEGCMELAWVMGYIKFFDSILESTGERYIGWVDSKTGDPVDDMDIKARYEKDILNHTGIRLIEPELHDGYDPNKQFFMRELQIEHDMDPFETNKEEAEHFKLQNNERVDAWENSDGTWSVRFLKGAIIMVPKAFRFMSNVTAQIPTGWDPIHFGIPEDIAKKVDPIVCYGLVTTVEALLRSGIVDPYELYSYLHVSKVGSSVGSTLLGRQSATELHTNVLLDRTIPKDGTQRMIIGTVTAWINMLLLSSSGPIKTVSGACATSIISIDTAVETIQSGKAEVMFAGGVDGFDSFNYYLAGNVGALNNTLDETERGRVPSEMSRPCTTTRCGMVEGEGCGIVVLMSASAAVRMGVPIYGIIASSNTATDKVGKSFTAVGQGILAQSSEAYGPTKSNLLDFNYRKAKLEQSLKMIIQTEHGPSYDAETEAGEIQDMHKTLQDKWGNEFWKRDSSISPLRGALAVWGLDADDIDVVSFHGTSTIMNDYNESKLSNLQFKHLGRTPGNAVPVIAQKWLTGHPRAAAAAWMLNGVLQVLDTGLVPGNRNADNIDERLEQFEYLVYPSKSIQTTGVKAGLLKSFGFGQASGELLIVHPDYILATLSCDDLGKYMETRREREKKAYRYWSNSFVGNHTFVQAKEKPPYSKEQMQRIYLDSNSRANFDPKTKQYRF